MNYVNIPKDIIYKRWFKRPEVVYAYLCIYSHASKSAHRYTHLDQSTWLEKGECVITQSHGPEVMKHGNQGQTMSWIRTLLDSGLIIRKKVENFKETVYQVPALMNPEPGNYVQVFLPGRLDHLWKTSKYLLSTCIYMAIEAVSFDEEFIATIRKKLVRSELATTYNDIKDHCGCTREIARTIISWLEKVEYITKKALKGVGMVIKMMLYPKKKDNRPVQDIKQNSIKREAAPAQEQPRTLAPSPIVNDPPVKDPPSDPIEAAVRHYLFTLKRLKTFKPETFVPSLREMINKQGYDETLLHRCFDELIKDPVFENEYPTTLVVCKYVDAWYHDHSGLEQSSGTNGAATVAPEKEKQAKALLDKIWSEMGRSRYEYIFTKHVSCQITDDLVIISDLQTTCQRIHDNSYAQEAIAKSVSAIFDPSMKFEVKSL